MTLSIINLQLPYFFYMDFSAISASLRDYMVFEEIVATQDMQQCVKTVIALRGLEDLLEFSEGGFVLFLLIERFGALKISCKDGANKDDREKKTRENTKDFHDNAPSKIWELWEL